MSVKKCELHGTDLVAMDVPISYGFPAFDPAWEVEKELFPNARSHVLGGCIVDFDKVTQPGMVCEDCRNAKEAWRRENGITIPPPEASFDN